MKKTRKNIFCVERRNRAAALLIAAAAAMIFAASCASSPSKKGDEFFSQGRYDEAVAQYKLGLAEKPDDAKMQGKLQVASEHAAERHYDAGAKAMAEMRPRAAAAEFEAALKYAPEHRKAKESLEAASALVAKITSEMDAGKKLLADKKYFEAMDHFRNYLKYSADFPDAQTTYNEALAAAFESLMQQGYQAFNEEKFDEALAIFTRAQTLKPGDQSPARMIVSTRRQIEAARNNREGEALLKAGDFRNAIARFEVSLAAAPANPRATEGMAKAKALGAAALFEEGTAALKDGKAATAAAAFVEAMGYAPNTKGLAEKTREAQQALAKKLFERGREMQRTSDFALAYIFYTQADAFDSSIEGLKDALAASSKQIDEARSYSVLVTGDGVDANFVARAIVEARYSALKSGVVIYGVDELRAIREKNPGFTTNGIMSITLGEPKITYDRPRVERRSVRYVSGTEIVAVPIYRMFPPYPRRSPRHPYFDEDRNMGYKGPSPFPRDRYPYRNIDRYPVNYRYYTVNTYSTYYYNVTTNTVRGAMTASCRLVDAQLGKELYAGIVSADATDADTVVEGFEPAEIREDPDELMTSAQIEAAMKAKILSRLTATMGYALRRHPERFVEMSDKAKAGGDEKGWVNFLALYVLTGGEDTVRLRQIDSVLREKTGYSVMQRRSDYAALEAVLGER